MPTLPTSGILEAGAGKPKTACRMRPAITILSVSGDSRFEAKRRILLHAQIPDHAWSDRHGCARRAPALRRSPPPRRARRRRSADHLQAVAPGDYAHFGQVALTTPANQGDIANLGIIVGGTRSPIVDTGGSVEVGRALLAAVQQRDRQAGPLRHQHPRASRTTSSATPLRRPGVTFVGHHNLPPDSLAERGAFYLRSFRDPARRRPRSPRCGSSRPRCWWQAR